MTDLNAEQIGLDLGDAPTAGAYQANLAEIREDLAIILTSARDVTALSPWDRRTYRYNQIVFAQMTRWLPEDEAAQLCFQFAQEMDRIELLLAA